ncbi:MAG: tripartite tricarboxylate transporter substrate binding protein BugD [Hyphomicrobiales bacterium]|nr:tripartite tricarboxylate transporter substrate binding protein BugD [Hyphomicrobiales bacterium]
MPLARRRLLELAGVAAAAAASARVAWAQVYPARPITMIVPFPPGGPVDTIGRLVADRMRASFGQPVVVENVIGASGSIGLTRAARAAPNGYTIHAGNWSSHVGSPASFPLQLDVLTDLAPISLLPMAPTLIVGRKGLPANDLRELIAWLKENPGKATSGTNGAGSPSHVSAIYFQNQTGTQLQFVPYRGGAALTQAIVASEIDLRVGAEASQTLQYVRKGDIKAFAVLGERRWQAAPEIPTIDEAGVRGLHISLWNGLWAPKGTSKEIVAKLNAAVVEALATTTVQQRLAEIGFELPTREQQTPEGLAAFHRAETARWWPVIKAAGIKVE